MKELIIGGKKVSDDSSTLIIAEAGINHDGKLSQAKELIDMSAEAGADIVKFQLFKANKMYTSLAGDYTTARGEIRPILDILRESELQNEWVPILMEYSKKKNLGFLCTVCDEEAADVLNNYGVDSYKMASYAITHIPLLKHVARYNKPVILSTAGARISDVDLAVKAVNEEENNKIAVMHCVAKYPTPINECNLGIIKTFKYAFPDCIIGYSDHTEDPVIAPAMAVALGAKIIEKHITIDKSLPGADHSFAVNPKELEQMCKVIRETEHLREEEKNKIVNPDVYGCTKKDIIESEKQLRRYAYRCIFATKDISAGETITHQNTAILRPGNESRGLEPSLYEILIMKHAKITKEVKAGKAITWDNILSV